MSNQMIRQIQRQPHPPFRHHIPVLSCAVLFCVLFFAAAVQLPAQTPSRNTEKPHQTQANVYRIQCSNITELEKQLRSQFSSEISFSLNIKAETTAGNYRLAVTADESTQQNVLAVLRQNNAVFLPKNSLTVPVSDNALIAAPQVPVSPQNNAYPNIQTGFVPPQGIANGQRSIQPAYIPPSANPSANVPAQNPIRPAVPEVSADEVRDSFSPSRVSTAKIEQTLKSLLGTKLNEVAPNKYLLEVKEKDSSRKKHCSIDVDRENSRFIITGEKSLCDQVGKLLTAVDSPQLTNGWERQFISTSNVKPDTVARILQISNNKRQSTVPSALQNPTLQNPAALNSLQQNFTQHNLTPQNLTQQNFTQQNSVQQNSVQPQFSQPQFAQPVLQPSEEPAKIEFRQPYEPAQEQPLLKQSLPKQGVSMNGAAIPRPNPGIQLVGYEFQGELPAAGGGFDASMSGADIDPQMSGQMNPNGNTSGMEVVSDFRYQILPDLDVLIIDATGAEVARFKDMIEQIQELSKIADPKIEVSYLKNVNCVSLNWVIRQIFVDAGYFRTKQGMVTIIPLINPNGMLVIGWGHAFDSMKDLLETLDKPVAAENSIIQVIRLQHASAQSVMTVLRGAFPRPPVQNSGFAPRVEFFADSRTNSIIVQAAPNDLKEVQRIIAEIDVPNTAPKLLVQQFKLKHTLAADLSQVLNSAIRPGISGTPDKKLPSLQLLIEDEKGKRMLESGIMSDVSVSGNPHTNSLIVSAPEKAMPLIEQLIHLLDVPASEAEIKVFQILYGEANSLVQTLRSLIPTQIEGATGPQLPGSKSDETIIPIRFAVDTRTNSILAAGSEGDLKIVEALLYSMDREDQQKRKETVYMLRSMLAKDVAVAVNEYIESKRKIRAASPGVISAYQQIESEVIVIPENVNNALLISATPKYYDEIMELIKQMDQAPPQVLIQVLIGEVTLGNQNEFGAEFGIQDSLLFDRNTFNTITQATRKITQTNGGVTTVIEEPYILNGTATPGWLFNENPSSSLTNGYNSTAAQSAGNVGSQLLTNFATGRVGAETGFGGMVFSANSDAVSIMIRALQETNKLEVLSRPQIMAMNNQQALVHVGQKYPRVKGTTTNSYQSETKIEDEDVGLMLMVMPTISPEGNIVMQVTAQKSKISADSTVVGFSNNQPVRSPAIDVINAQTMISASDKETVVLGGLISKETQHLHRKVPLLGDIPILGKLFSYEYNKCRRSELLVILTPRIVRDKNDFEEVKQVEAARMNWCLRGVAELHGDIGTYSTVSEEPYIGNATVIMPEIVETDSLVPLEEFQRKYNKDKGPVFEVQGPYLQPVDKQTVKQGTEYPAPKLAPTQIQDNKTDNKNEKNSGQIAKPKMPIPSLPTNTVDKK
jgi:type II secretion system protein D